eukprot:tig00021108_g18319.t1
MSASFISAAPAVLDRTERVSGLRRLRVCREPHRSDHVQKNVCVAAASQRPEPSERPDRVFECSPAGRRKLLGDAFAAAAMAVLAPLAAPREAFAEEDDLVQRLVPILQAAKIVGQIPAEIEAENWDGIRNMVFKPPVGLLKTTWPLAAKALGGDDEMDALEELYDILENLRNVDINVYTVIFIPSADYQVKYIKFAMESYEKTQQNLNNFFEIVERNHADELKRAREIAEKTPIDQSFFGKPGKPGK